MARLRIVSGTEHSPSYRGRIVVVLLLQPDHAPPPPNNATTTQKWGRAQTQGSLETPGTVRFFDTTQYIAQVCLGAVFIFS